MRKPYLSIDNHGFIPVVKEKCIKEDMLKNIKISKANIVETNILVFFHLYVHNIFL